MLSDGKLRHVHYSIIEDGGFASFGQGVEWCVTGLDRNWAYNPGLQGRPTLGPDCQSFPGHDRASRFAGRKFCS